MMIRLAVLIEGQRDGHKT